MTFNICVMGSLKKKLSESLRWIFFFTVLTTFLTSCDDDNAEEEDNLVIERFAPLAALPGDTITIHGKGFNTEAVRNVVQFSSSKTGSEIPLAEIISSSENEMQAIVPAFTQSGLVKVAVGPLSALSQAPFLLSPSISVVQPEAARPGEQITIGGQNFTSDTADLVLFVGDVRIDSIFGASNSQVAFPLPFSVPSGTTTIRLGIKIQNDTVFAAAVGFVVIDAEKPELIRFEPDDQGAPGQEITLVGANFNPDETTVYFGGIVIELTEFDDINNEQIILNVPASLGPGPVSVTVTTKKANGEFATTDPLTFTVSAIEPVFYWTYGNRLGIPPLGVQRFAFGEKTSIPGGTGSYLGLTLSSDKSSVYMLIGYNDNVELRKAEASTFDEANAPSVLTQSLSFSADIQFYENKLYYTRTAEDKGIWVYDVVTEEAEKLYDLKISDEGQGPATRAANLKISGSFLYWTESFGGETVVVRADLSNPGANASTIFSNDTHSGKLTAILAIAVDGSDIYIVNTPYDNDGSGIVTGTSTIFRGDLDNPSAALEELYKDNVGKITDIEFYEGMLYYMDYTEDDQGGIFRVSPDGAGTREEVVDGIAYGAYFEVVRE